jgi:hypothetical protein
MTMSMRSELLRVALLVDSLVQPAWVRRLVDEIQRSDVARVALVVRNAARPPAPAPGGRLRIWYRNRAALLYTLYMRLDAWAFPARPDPFEPCDLSEVLRDVPVIDVVPRMTRFSDYFPDADVERVLAHRLDVALRLGFRILRGRALSVARHGVWSYHHGDNAVNRGGPAGFWEVMERHPATGSVLQVLSEELDGGRAIYRSYAATHPLSVNQNRLSYYWKSSTFVMRKLCDLHRDGAAALETTAQPALPAYTQRLYTQPTNAAMARLLGRLAARYVMRHVRARAGFRQWTLAYRLASARTTDDSPDLVFHRFRILEPPAGRFWADPFAAYAGGRHYILFEDYSYAARRGHISAIELGADGTPSAPVPVLQREYNLSYPFVFTWRGEHYMIPESNANLTVDVYRATRFPYEWEPAVTLFAGQRLVDVTLQEIDGRWWMFANAPATPEIKYESWTWDELHIFYADSPLGPWRAHPRNPVVSDVRRARPAGRLFQHHGTWYRPAQDCAGDYGARVAIQRIVRLDTSNYDETPETVLAPAWQTGFTGIHTINAAAGLTVVDVRVRRWHQQLLRQRVTAPRQPASPLVARRATELAPESPVGAALSASAVAGNLSASPIGYVAPMTIASEASVRSSTSSSASHARGHERLPG